MASNIAFSEKENIKKRYETSFKHIEACCSKYEGANILAGNRLRKIEEIVWASEKTSFQNTVVRRDRD